MARGGGARAARAHAQTLRHHCVEISRVRLPTRYASQKEAEYTTPATHTHLLEMHAAVTARLLPWAAALPRFGAHIQRRQS